MTSNPKVLNLPDKWADTMANLYKEGASDTEIRAELRISQALWDNLYSDVVNSSFREVVDFGRMLAKAWWMRLGRTELYNRQFNSQLWLMNMKNRFGWSERTEVQSKSVDTMDEEQLNAYISQALAKFARSAKG